MLEGLATWVLNNYLGQYLENLNTHQLSIGLLKGEVELENVPLRKDALRHLDMPLEVRTGFVGKVKLQIPVSRLRSEPWVIIFEQLYLVAGPVKLNEYDEEAEEAASQGRKISQLDGLEAAWRSDQESRNEASHYASSYTSWLSYGTSFMTNIIENIQLKIRDVHLRYEDDECFINQEKKQIFSFGMTIDSLSLQSSDAHWIPRFVYGGDSKMAYKLLELTNLGFYWDTNSEVYSNKTIAELADQMLTSISKKDHEYILSPVSAAACVKRNLSEAPLRSKSSPRITCDIKLESFPLTLSDSQYHQMLSWNKEYDRLEKARHHRKWRPHCSVKDNPNDWWQYAIEVHVDKINKKYTGRNWSFVIQRARDIVKYIKIYKEHLRNPATVTTECKSHKILIEQELNFEELRCLREIAMEQVSKELISGKYKKDSPSKTTSAPISPSTAHDTMLEGYTEEGSSPIQSGEGILQRWFPAWNGWYYPQDTISVSNNEGDEVPKGELENISIHEIQHSPEVPPPESDSTVPNLSDAEKQDPQFKPGSPSLEEELLYVLSDSVENNTFMKRDVVFCQLSFTLRQGTFKLSSYKPVPPKTSSHDTEVNVSETPQESKNERVELFVLEFDNVKMSLDSRPRSKSYKFDIELGSVTLHDKVTVDSAFPQLVCPQKREGGSSLKAAMSRTSTMYSKLTSILAPTQKQSLNQGPLFSLKYEARPFASKADHRLIVNSNALDIVYHPSALEEIKKFFTSPYQREEEMEQLSQMTALGTAAKKRYEELKEQTKQELKKNWEQMMEGSMLLRKRWDIQLNVSAPQIILPENFHDRNATLVVLDFGKLIFCSAQPMSNTKLNDEIEVNSDDEDEFATPCSTPDELETMDDMNAKLSQGFDLSDDLPISESALHDHMYDRYDLKLCDMQVIVGKVRDNWRYAYVKGTGHMHVLDRFSINLQMERRVVMLRGETGQQWPSATLAGTLPSLVVHVNEQKVLALRTMVQALAPPKPKINNKTRPETSVPYFSADDISRSSTVVSIDDPASDNSRKSDSPTADEGKLLIMQFTVDKLSLELQSRGRSIAELQVTGVKANFNKRPYETSSTLSVHSLLLVDALQTFGPDFELLVASHKHVSMDSVSGSLLDSEPCSPTSPASPDHNVQPFKPTSPLVLSQAISSLAAARGQSPPQFPYNTQSSANLSSPLENVSGIGNNNSSSSSHVFASQESRDSEALITVEVTYVSPHCPTQQAAAGALLLASVQFNTLDIIANQETVVELVGFVQQLFPHSPSHPLNHPHTQHPSPSTHSGTDEVDGSPEHYSGDGRSVYASQPSLYYVAPEKSPVRMEVRFDFHKLTVLLLRGIQKDKELIGRKVGTAVLSDAKIEATVEQDILTVEGSLGGFQIRDVTPEGNKHQCIISVGQDPVVERSQDVLSRLNSELYRSYAVNETHTRAFSFTVIRPLAFSDITGFYGETPSDKSPVSESERKDDPDNLTLKLRLASVCYTHSPHFLRELKSCATEFKQYMARVASSLKHAATEMAIGLVSKRIESFAGLSSGNWESSPRHRQRLMSTSRSTDTLNLPAPPPASGYTSHFSPVMDEANDLPFNLSLDIILETPVVVLPESPNSPDVLVAHLGQISIANSPATVQQPLPALMALPPSKVSEYRVVVRDMSLFSLNVEERLKTQNLTFQGMSSHMINAEDLYNCMDHGRPILHSTTVELYCRHEQDPYLLGEHQSGLFLPSDFFIDLHHPMSRDSVHIDGGIINSLKISVTRQQYWLILTALTNLSHTPHENLSTQQGLSSISEEDPSSVSGQSASHTTGMSASQTAREKPSIAVKGSFSVPSLCIELRGDVGTEKEKPLVNLLLEDLKATYESCEPYKTRTQVTLESLKMEDLQYQGPESSHRLLMTSDCEESEDVEKHQQHHTAYTIPTQGRDIPRFISTSAPEPWQHQPPVHQLSSLPDRVTMEKPYFQEKHRPQAKLYRGVGVKIPGIGSSNVGNVGCSANVNKSPCTPPPSPTPEDHHQHHPHHQPDPTHHHHHSTLVNITISTIDKRSPDFYSKYDGTNRYVDVDFNSLVTVINIPSWVMVVDFFTMDHDQSTPSEQFAAAVTPEANIPAYKATSEELNTIMEIQVKSLTLILNKPECELARARVSQVLVRSVGSEGNLTLTGRLGSLSLVDCTPVHGNLYRERFLTYGNEALTFQVFRYGHPDPNMMRECDIRVKVKMSSVLYMHTQRFSMELLQFVQQFNQLRDIMSRWRATNQGIKVSDFSRGSRVSLDISAGSPVIFLPMSGYSENLIVADLGSLTITNKFLWAGSKGTISQVQRQDLKDRLMISGKSQQRTASSSRHHSASHRSRSRSHSRHRDASLFLNDSEAEVDSFNPSHKCLLDVMYIDLVNMDLYTSIRTSLWKMPSKTASTSKEQCDVDQVEWVFGSYRIERQGHSLLKDKCALKLQVERNLDSMICHSVPDMSVHGMLSKVHATVNLSQYKIVRGLLMYNLGEQLPQPQDPMYPYQQATDQDMFGESGVWTALKIHIDLDNVMLDIEVEEEKNKSTKRLAVINYIKSRLVYESFSDSSKDVDLVSQEILISDTRFEGFPVNKRSNIFTNILQPAISKARKNDSLLQAEVHYRSTKDVTRFTILLNNMRLMGILDWWAEIQDFIYTEPENPFKIDGSRHSDVSDKNRSRSQATSPMFSPFPSPLSTPLTQSPPPLSPRPSSPCCMLQERRSATPRLNPMVESTGVMTKHTLIQDSQRVPFEIKLNITDSELVLVESTDVWDTSAVILRSTAVISFRPQHTERPLSCNLNQCELYSCILGLEEDTALSIIDPVTVNIEVNDRAPRSPDIDVSIATQHTVEVVLHQLNIRLSYHDMKMFQQILESVPKQQKTAIKNKTQANGSQQPANFQAQVNKLSVLGFLPEDCMKALEECQGRLDDAALWLTHNAHPAPSPTLLYTSQIKNESINFQGLEVKTGGVNICIIDDCGDCDVPLLEISLSHLGLKQDWEGKGSAACNLSMDYYNRYLSGWEPFLEPWKCSAEWSKCPSKDLIGKRLNLQVDAQDTVNINLTSTVLELYHMVKNNWTQDYYNRDRVEIESSVVSTDGKANVVSPQGYRRRSPFIPFALKNDTGCELRFATLTSTPDNMVDADNSGLEKVSEEDWMQVAPGGTHSFSFEGRGKQRHRDTRELKVHQLMVRVEGWGPVGPVTVDKVGVFFRLAPPRTENLSVLYTDLPSARVVMEVTLEGSARKLITVRSALLLTNKLSCPVDIKLDNITMRHGDTKIIQVSTQSSIAVPLMYAWSRLYVRPINTCGSGNAGGGGGGGFLFCQEPLHWFTLVEPHQETANLRLCPAINTHLEPYRFCVQVKRDNFPVDTNTGTSSATREWIQPGHSIVLMSPLTVVNLLPCEVHYTIKQTTSPQQGRIKPGGNAHLHSIDPHRNLTMNIWTDTLTSAGEVTVVPSSSVYVVSIKFYDAHKRILHLHMKVRPHNGGAVKISVFAAYWLINKIGLPLIFKQDGGSYESAGQDTEHEVARCAAPLMFSFSDRDAVPMLMARVGKMLHHNAKPQYCHKLPLTQGTWVRRLRVSPQDSRPDWVYIVGVDVRPGRGRYRDTYMVTFSPRFQIENRSSHKLHIAQKGYTSSFNDPAASGTWLTAIPGCWLPFHWPRLDKEQLLCLRLQDVPNSHWSGGFPIEMISSFHLNIRNSVGQSFFVRVEIIINDATYFIVFTDAESIPPPFRIDNYSEVAIIYYQTGTQEERLRTVVKSHSSIHYAWDEVMLQPHLTCVAPGGTSATYNLNVLGEGAKLTYENFIYIAFTATFKRRSRKGSGKSEEVTLDPTSVECQQLVLDVPEGTRVTLARKEIGRRSQLWRMTSTGMLQHEGSSPPHDPSIRRSSKTNNNILVLDIAGPAPQPNSYTPLMLRKPDDRRRLTQTWRYTDDGQLCCLHANLFVQAKDGFPGLNAGNDVVLGPPQLVHYDTMENGIPYEQAISRQRLRPGSGLLAVKVVTDGPTRVLQIMDVHCKSTSLVARTENGDWLSTTQEGGTTSIRRTTDGLPSDKSSEGGTLKEVQVRLKMSGGLGLSVVQRPPPQELVYVKLTDIVAEYQSTAQHRIVDCSIRDIQVDNQLITAQCPVTLYVTPLNKNDESRYLPALVLTAHQIISPCTNAVIFKHLMVTLKNLTLTLEEELVFKLLLMLGYDQSDSELEKVEEQQYAMRRMLAAATSVNCTRYYFTHLNLLLHQVRLSVLTSKRMSLELKKIKHKMGLTLVRFENAQVNLDPFLRYHPFETSRFLLDSITNHYREELKSQALRILGSTDFLGNPFGFLADVSEGVTELVNEGSVGGLVWNVTHGMANSTAKVTGSISDAVVRVTMDDRHEESRQRLRQQLSSNSADHFVAGLRGLGLGIYGGLTSIVSQTYSGASQEGFPGFFSGFAKGMVGTVTKPAIGFLDLASGTASAVRDTSKNPEKKMPGRIRKPRLVIGLNGMMPRYSPTQADGQELLLSFSPNNEEIFLGYEVLREGEEDLRVLISSNQVRVFSQIETSLPPTIVLNVLYTELYSCRAVVVQMDEKLEQKNYLELTMKADKAEVSGVPQPSQQPCKRPKVRCDSRTNAQKVAQQINYARNLHEELRQTVFSKEEDNVDDA